jgi:hypothetical protein
MSNGKLANNPYLQRVASPRSAPTTPAQKEPLYGWVPRRVKGEDVKKVIVGRAKSPMLPFLNILLGRRHQSIHKAAAFSTIQENLGSP